MSNVCPEGCWWGVSGGQVWGRLWLCWMDGRKVAFGNRGMTVEAAQQCAKDRKSGEPWNMCNWMSYIQPFLLGPVFFWTAHPCSGGCGMPLNDTVGINCKTGVCFTINCKKSRCGYQVCGLWGVCLMIVCVLSDLAWLPHLGGEGSRGILLLLFLEHVLHSSLIVNILISEIYVIIYVLIKIFFFLLLRVLKNLTYILHETFWIG